MQTTLINFLYISLIGSNKISDDKKFIKSLQQAIQSNIDQEGVIQNVRKSFKDLKEGKTSPSDNPFSTLHNQSLGQTVNKRLDCVHKFERNCLLSSCPRIGTRLRRG